MYFDPDTTNCASGAFKTPPVIKYWELATPFWPSNHFDSEMWVRAGKFRRDLSAIMFYGDTRKLAISKVLGRSSGFLHAIKLSSIDAIMDANDDIVQDRFDLKSRKL